MAGEEVTSYPLNTSWGIWELREQGKNSSYSDKLYKLCSFSTVEEFWGYWNHIPKPSQVLFDGFTRKRFADRAVESYAIFKEGIVPEWEDPENKKGGEWSVRKELSGPVLDELWDRLVLGTIGETIDPADEITGIRVIHKNKKDKKEPGNNYRFEIWLRSQDRGAADEIRGKIMECLTGSDNIGVNWTAKEFVYKNH